MNDILIGRRDGEVPADRLLREMRFEVRAEAVDRERRTVELSFSSDAPYKRWWGIEVLDHNAASVRLDRLNGAAALLVNHDVDEHVGVVERAWIAGGKGRAVVRFGRSGNASEVFEDVCDGIRKLVSVGYRIHRMILEDQDEDTETYRVIDWEPFEISIVSIPADTTVGVGREGEPPAFDPRTLVSDDEEEDDMNMIRNAGAGGVAPVAAPAAAAPVPAQRAVETPAPAPAHAAPIAAPSVDVRQIAEQERQRGQNIRAMGERLDCADLATAAIADGRSLDQFIADYRQAAGNASQIRTAESPEIGMSANDLRRFSVVRLLHASINPADASAREAAAFELEACNAALARGQAPAKPGAIRIPYDVMVDQRDLMVGTPTAGGNLVATDLLAGSFIDILINRLALAGLGATMLTGLNGNVAIPRATGGASVFWVAEGAQVTESQPSFDQVALSPKTAGTFVDMSRQLLLQSSLSVENFVRMDLARRMALGIDLAGVSGTGSASQPRGVLNTSGIGSLPGAANGEAPTWEHIIDLETLVAVQNADIGSTGYLTNAKVRGKLKKTQKFSGTNGDPVWADGAEPLNGYRAAVSNQIPSNLVKGSSGAICSAILFGNWSDVLIGLWGGLDILPNPYILTGTGSVRLEVFQSCDVAVRHPESFAVKTDVLTA